MGKLCLPFSIRSEGHCRKCEVKDEEEVHTRACGHSQVWQCYDLVVANFRSVLSKNELQRFRVRHGLSCVFGPVWPVGAGCYSQAALPMPLSKPLSSINIIVGGNLFKELLKFAVGR